METFQWPNNNNNNDNNIIITTTTTTVRMIIIHHHHRKSKRQLNRDNNKSSAINLPSSSCSWRCFWSRLNDFDWTLGSGGWPHADDSSAKPTGKKKNMPQAVESLSGKLNICWIHWHRLTISIVSYIQFKMLCKVCIGEINCCPWNKQQQQNKFTSVWNDN